jgi:NAD(P)-dependent dehydrogenase (short-subunit alcohol dehydrogenase family)
MMNPALPLDGRLVLVTGAAGDIGMAIVRHSLQAGAKVALLDSDAAALQAVTPDSIRGPGVMRIECDVSDPAQVQSAVQSVVAQWQAVHALVNNAAAITPSAPIGEADMAHWQRTLDVNLTGPWLLAKACIPHMARAGGGVVLNIASQVGQVAVRGRGAYGVSKAALIALTRAIAVDYAEQGIRAVSLSPGAVMTQRLTSRYGSPDQVTQTLAPHYPLGRLGTPDEIARIAVFLMSDAASFVTGCDWLADGGYTAV